MRWAVYINIEDRYVCYGESLEKAAVGYIRGGGGTSQGARAQPTNMAMAMPEDYARLCEEHEGGTESRGTATTARRGRGWYGFSAGGGWSVLVGRSYRRLGGRANGGCRTDRVVTGGGR